MIAQAWLDAPSLVLDTETTGLNDNVEIVELCLLDTTGTVLLNNLIRPVNPIPQAAIEIHGITNEAVADAPIWAEVHE